MQHVALLTAEGKLVEIIAHRGSWTRVEEHNSLTAFQTAWSVGAGVETDLRDLDGDIVISHDMPRTCPEPMTLAGLLIAWDTAGRRGRLALNIKADGLAAPVSAALNAAGATNSAFVFDMSVPDQVAHTRTSTPVMARWSDLEAPVLTGTEVGLWLDAFSDDSWWDAGDVRQRLADGLQVVLVSPELHHRPHLPTWQRLRAEGLDDIPGFALCTDHVAHAQAFFTAGAPADRHLQEVCA